jgi:hypothetical protein
VREGRLRPPGKERGAGASPGRKAVAAPGEIRERRAHERARVEERHPTPVAGGGIRAVRDRVGEHGLRRLGVTALHPRERDGCAGDGDLQPPAVASARASSASASASARSPRRYATCERKQSAICTARRWPLERPSASIRSNRAVRSNCSDHMSASPIGFGAYEVSSEARTSPVGTACSVSATTSPTGAPSIRRCWASRPSRSSRSAGVAPGGGGRRRIRRMTTGAVDRSSQPVNASCASSRVASGPGRSPSSVTAFANTSTDSPYRSAARSASPSSHAALARAGGSVSRRAASRR